MTLHEFRDSWIWKLVSDISIAHWVMTGAAVFAGLIVGKATSVLGKPLYLVLLCGLAGAALFFVALYYAFNLLASIRSHRAPAHLPTQAMASFDGRLAVEKIPALENVPHLDLIYDLPKTDIAGRLLRDEQITVVNTTDLVAYDVEIQPKESSRYTAKFDRIARVGRDHPVKAEVDVRLKPDGPYFHSVEAICHAEYEDAPPSPDGYEVRVPLAVRFYDSRKNRQYETIHEIIYDSFWGEAHIHLLVGTRLVMKS